MVVAETLSYTHDVAAADLHGSSFTRRQVTSNVTRIVSCALIIKAACGWFKHFFLYKNECQWGLKSPS